MGGNLLRHTVPHQEICTIFMLIKDVSYRLLMGSCSSGLKLQYNIERREETKGLSLAIPGETCHIEYTIKSELARLPPAVPMHVSAQWTEKCISAVKAGLRL